MDLTEQKIESDIRNARLEEWRTAEETDSDKVLHFLISCGKKNDEIIKEFCLDLESKPKFNKMTLVNRELCENIIYAWENALECNITDNHEAHETNAVPGQYDNSIIPF